MYDANRRLDPCYRALTCLFLLSFAKMIETAQPRLSFRCLFGGSSWDACVGFMEVVYLSPTSINRTARSATTCGLMVVPESDAGFPQADIHGWGKVSSEYCGVISFRLFFCMSMKKKTVPQLCKTYIHRIVERLSSLDHAETGRSLTDTGVHLGER